MRFSGLLAMASRGRSRDTERWGGRRKEGKWTEEGCRLTEPGKGHIQPAEQPLFKEKMFW